MAIEIKFKGYVNRVKTFDWGTAYDVSHNQVRKSPSGEWETIGRDYFSVIGPAGFNENDQVEIVGNLKTKFYEGDDGQKRIALNVNAKEMHKVEGRGASHAEMQTIWPEVRQVGTEKVSPVSDGAPF